MAQQNIYDNNDFYETFRKIRDSKVNFNDLIETPIITGMLPELKGKKSTGYRLWYGTACYAVCKCWGIIRYWNRHF